MRAYHLGRVVLFALLVVAAPAVAQTETTGKPDLELAEQLLRDGRAQEAYELLEPYEFDYSGNLKYDYLLGLAALESERPEHATLVFERVLALEPRYVGVRLDLARSYFYLGDLARATREFQVVLAQNSPQDLKDQAQQYLQVLQEGTRPRRLALDGYVELSGGYDSNVNSATSTTPINIAGGNQPFFVEAQDLQQEDVYASVAMGAEAGYVLTPNWSAYVGGDVSYRGYEDKTSANFAVADTYGGIGLTHGNHLARVGASMGRFFLDDDAYRKNQGYNAEWRYQRGDRDQVSINVQYTEFRYLQADQSTSNFDQTLIALGWLRLLASENSLFSISLIGGTDTAAGGRSDGDADLTGLRFFTQTSTSDNVSIFVNLGALHSQYERPNDLFLVTRSEWMYDVTLGASWQIAPKWSLRPQLTYIRNNSNASLYAFTRVDAALNLRRDFRWP